MFMYSFHTDGSIVNKRTNETFRWHHADTLSKTTVVDVVVSKLTVLVAIALGFISLSAMTGVVVRVLIADGTLVIAATAQVLRLCIPRFGITTEMAVQPYVIVIGACVGAKRSLTLLTCSSVTTSVCLNASF